MNYFSPELFRLQGFIKIFIVLMLNIFHKFISYTDFEVNKQCNDHFLLSALPIQFLMLVDNVFYTF